MSIRYRVATLAGWLITLALPVGAESELINDHDVRSLHAAEDGTVWVGTRGAGLSRWDGQQLRQISPGDLGLESVSAIIPSPDGTMWFGGPGGVTSFDGTTWTRFEQLGRPIRVVFGGVADEDGTVWLGTTEGVVYSAEGGWKWLSEGLRHEVVHDIHRDAAGSLWFATRRGGLSCLHADGSWSHFLDESNVRMILEDDDQLWFGTSDGVFRLRDGRWDHFQAGGAVLPLFRDSSRRLWFARGTGGAWKLLDGEWTPETDQLTSTEIHAGVEGVDGSLWFGTSDGLRRLIKDR